MTAVDVLPLSSMQQTLVAIALAAFCCASTPFARSMPDIAGTAELEAAHGAPGSPCEPSGPSVGEAESRTESESDDDKPNGSERVGMAPRTAFNGALAARLDAGGADARRPAGANVGAVNARGPPAA